MKWFKHDANAHIDAKLKKVKHKYGIVGYGLYWYCIELIAMGVDKNNITFELEEDSETVAMEWNLDQLKVQEIMEYFVHLNLFELNDGRVTCFKLARRLDDTSSRNPEIRKLLGLIVEPEKEESEPLELRESPKTSDESQKDFDQIRLDKIRLDIKDLFKVFWSTYPNKQGKAKAQKTWESKVKTVELANQIVKHVEIRKLSDPQWTKDRGEFIPLPTTFLNQERWEDEYKKLSLVGVTERREL